MAGDWTPEKIESILPQDWDVVSHVPTLADAWDVNGPAIAQNMRDAAAAVRDPQTWTDAAREYGQALVAGTGIEGGGMKAVPALLKSPEFRNWFGASKVVGPDGMPKVVYHGTPSDVPAFQEGHQGSGISNGRDYYFTDSPVGAGTYASGDRQSRALWSNVEKAQDAKLENPSPENKAEYQRAYAEWEARIAAIKNEGGQSGANITPAHLSIENPMIVDAEGRGHYDINGGNGNQGMMINPKFDGDLQTGKRGPSGEPMFAPDPRGKVPSLTINDYVRLAKEAGNDGLIVKNVVDVGNHKAVAEMKNAGGATTYVAFDPTQIKSAVSNTGAFNPRDPSINYVLPAMAGGGAAAVAQPAQSGGWEPVSQEPQAQGMQ